MALSVHSRFPSGFFFFSLCHSLLGGLCFITDKNPSVIIVHLLRMAFLERYNFF